MRITVRTTPQQREFFIKDDFTTRDEKRFFDVFMQIRSMTESRLVFNLSECTAVDSAGTGMLIVACEEAAKRNVSRVIRQADPKVKKMLLSAGLDRFYFFE